MADVRSAPTKESEGIERVKIRICRLTKSHTEIRDNQNALARHTG